MLNIKDARKESQKIKAALKLEDVKVESEPHSSESYEFSNSSENSVFTESEVNSSEIDNDFTDIREIIRKK